MPTLITSLNGNVLAQVNTDGFDVMSVMVQGTCVDDEIADLRMTGGKYPDDAESVYLTWVDSQHLKAGDWVEVTIQQEGCTSHPGQTFSEQSSSEAQDGDESRSSVAAQAFADLRSTRRVRRGFCLDLETSQGTHYSGETTPVEHGFGLTVLWNRHRPGRARVSLYSYTIDGLEQRAPMHYHVQQYIEPLTTLRFRVNAE